MTHAELLNHLQTIGKQLIQLQEYSGYQRLCDKAHLDRKPTVEDGLNAVLHAIKWAESQSG